MKILAFDFGASSGRAMRAEFDGDKIVMEEIHRFSNDPVLANGTMYWDFLRLLFEIKTGITKAVNSGGFDSIGIDTWGVDFGLIGHDGQLMQNPVHYRDKRTDNSTIYDTVSKDEIYNSTGIQHMQINTSVQLFALAQKNKKLLEEADKLLMSPDLLSYFLTGEKKEEYTIASTSQLLDAKKRDWDFALIKKLGIPTHVFCEIIKPGDIYGTLSDEICEELGAPRVPVVAVPSHDTASAVLATPSSEKDFIYVSCGTWSLLGTESDQPILSDLAKQYNFTNEGGVNDTIRFLKNIMGTWLIQESRRQWRREGVEMGFGELEKLAEEAQPFGSLIDVDNELFVHPGNMPKRIREFCKKTGQPVPQSYGEIVRTIDESLAFKYRYEIEHMEACTGKVYDTIYLLGGGSQSKLLCRMAADACGKNVSAGPVEATVLGNIAVQLMAAGKIKSVGEAREVISRSETVGLYKPQDTAAWDAQYERYKSIVGK